MTSSVVRVGVVVPRFAPYRGGVETYVASAAAGLAAVGAAVTVITQAPRGAGLARNEVSNGYTVERHHLPVTDVFDMPSRSAVRAASRPGRFDVLWVHSYHTPLAWLVAESSACPIVFTPHYHGVGHTPLRQALHRAYRPAGKRLMTASSRIVVDTDAEANLVLRHFPRQVQHSQIAVIPPAIADPVRGWPAYPGMSNVVLTVARQEPYKRTDLLIRAVAELRGRRSPARLIVVGEGSALSACRELTARLGAEDVVTFSGAIDDETLRRWWASASLYATASRQEAYGIGLAEALIAGIPVVASDIPAHREVIARAGSGAAARLCASHASDAEAVSQYADAMSELLTATSSRKERAARCTLPVAGDVVGQLLEVLTAVSDRARL